MEGMLALLRAAKTGDKEASEKLIVENAGLIWSIARRYFGRGVDADDLYQLGCVGFIKAIRGYDESFGTQFSTYAVPKISGEIRRFLRDDGSVKVSRRIKERATAIRSVRSALEQSLGREPTISEIAQRLNLTPEEIEAAETAVEPAQSLQRECGEDGFTLEQILGDGGDEERLLEHVALRSALETLPEKESSVLALRYYRGMTQEAAARVLGVSQVQVSRLERRAVEKLRKLLS